MLTNIDEVKIFGAYAALPSPSLRVCSEIRWVAKMKTHGAHLKAISVLIKYCHFSTHLEAQNMHTCHNFPTKTIAQSPQLQSSDSAQFRFFKHIIANSRGLGNKFNYLVHQVGIKYIAVVGKAVSKTFLLNNY